MTHEKIVELYNQIEEEYYNKNYKKILDLINEYLELHYVGITDQLLTIYVDCCIGLNKFEDGVKILKIIEKLYPDTYSKFSLAKRYIYCFEFDEAINIIDNNEFTAKDYHDFAKRFLLAGECYLAKKYFEKCILTSEDNFYTYNAKIYINKIEKHIKAGIFIEKEYNAFKRCGETLSPGYVIYAKVNDTNYKKIDPVCDKRPYMIWKINGDKLYCFPLSQKTRTNNGMPYGYTLYSQKYLNFDSDRVVKCSNVIIKERDIQKVYEKIIDEDFKFVIRSVYNNICTYDKRGNNKLFIADCIENMNINLGNIIVLYNREENIKKFYYVLNITNKKKKYEVLELSYDGKLAEFHLLNSNPLYIKNNKIIHSVIKLSDERQKELDLEVNKVKKVKPVVGNIILYDNKKLLILKEDKEYYTCIDKSENIDISFVSIKYLNKNFNYEVIDVIKNDELIKEKYNFQKYLSSNFKEQKKLILK